MIKALITYENKLPLSDLPKNFKNILVFAGKTSLVNSGAEEQLKKILKALW